MFTRSVLAAMIVLASATHAVAQATIFVVRHAERADAVGGGAAMMASDPELSEAGMRRAENLAAMLKDAGIGAIYATEFKRTQQTAAPLATALGLTTRTVASKNTAGLVQELKRATGGVLVVGHSNTVTEIVEALGATRPQPVGDADYDNLFIVTMGAEPRVIRLHYR